MLYVYTNRNPETKALITAAVNVDRERAGNRPTVFPLGFTAEESRWDWKDFSAAMEIATALGKGFIATDAGPCVSPRYDVIQLPKVGDKVSKEFNGDSYPCGVIVKISPTFKSIRTDGGDVFYRVRQTGSWRNEGTWFLTPGHVSKQNPSF